MQSYLPLPHLGVRAQHLFEEDTRIFDYTRRVYGETAVLTLFAGCSLLLAFSMKLRLAALQHAPGLSDPDPSPGGADLLNTFGLAPAAGGRMAAVLRMTGG